MSERLAGNEADPKQKVLNTIDGIIANNPKSKALMPDGSHFTFSVGRCEHYGEQGTPRQVIIANRDAYGGVDRTAVVAVRARDPKDDFRFHEYTPDHATTPQGQPLPPEAVEDLDTLLGQTDFSDGSLVQELQRRMTTPGYYPRGLWVEALVEAQPIAEL